MIDIPKEELLAAFGRVPRPIREFASSEDLGVVASTLAQKYHLHVDAAGALSDTITKTLLGFVRPEELPKLLSDKLLLEQTVASALIGDINTMVFIPLQKKVREAAEADQQEREVEQELSGTEEIVPEETPVQPVATKPAPLPPPALDYAPAAATLPGSPVAAPMPVAAEILPVAPVQAALEPTVAQPVPQQHFVHTMPQSSPQPGWHPAAAVHIFVPTHGAPQYQAPSLPAEQVVAPQAPAAPEAPQPPVYVERPAVEIPVPAQTTPAPSAPLQKSYAADPYRESV